MIEVKKLHIFVHMEKVRYLDEQLFVYLNGLHHPALDRWMVMISSYWAWVVVFVILGMTIYWYNRQNKQILFYLGVALFSMGITNLLKPFIKRPRPIHYEEWSGIIHNIDKYSYTYSFYSSHAASVFCIAMFTYLSLKSKRWIAALAFVWAFLVSYSRIYVGKHFPGDVLVGMLVGCLLGYLAHFLYLKYRT